MVTIGMNYQVLEGKQEVFEDACRKVLDVMREADGHDRDRGLPRTSLRSSPHGSLRSSGSIQMKTIWAPSAFSQKSMAVRLSFT